MKRILSCIDGSPFTEANCQYAAWLAQQLDTGVQLLHVTDQRKLKASNTLDVSGTIGIGAYQTLLQEMVELEENRAKLEHKRAKLILQDAEARVKELGVQDTVTAHHTGFVVDDIAKFEADSAIAVLGRRGETADFAPGHLGSNIQRITRISTIPCFLTAQTFRPIQKVLIAYDGGPRCEQMVSFLGDYPVFQQYQLHGIGVGSSPDDPVVGDRLKTLNEKLTSYGYLPTLVQRHGDVTANILDYAAAENIDLIMMGAYSHSRIRNLFVGSTTAQIMRHCELPLLLFR
ncbi:MAG: universal stress protein [Cyanobacteria bacterium P01_H01_bin.130]